MNRQEVVAAAALLAMASAFVGALIVAPSKAQIAPGTACGQSVSVALGAATLTTVIPAPAAGNARFFVCGYSVSSVAASVVTFSYGTGTNCGTTNAAAGPTIQLKATDTNVDSSAWYRGFPVPPAPPQNLCATATTAANITVYYIQQ